MGSDKKDAMRRRRAKRLAERAERFERHAALANKRTGDARYAQRTTNSDGSVTSTPRTSEVDDLRNMMEAAAKRFRAKFSREMTPDDPVFFAPRRRRTCADGQGEMIAEVRDHAERMPKPEMRAHMLTVTEWATWSRR
ncbi:hypothetical protein AB0C74_33460 [Spirillospora sp. NPDC048832]